VPEQPSLFNEAEAVVDATGEQPIAEPTADEVTRRVVKPRGQSLVKTAGLPVVEVRHALTEAECVCPECSHALHEIGVDVSEKLEFIPARYWVERHERAKYGCRHCANHGTQAPVVATPMAPAAFPGSMATPSIVAHIVSQKYETGMPLYRLEQYLAPRGLELSRQTMANWTMRGAKALEPLYDRMHAL
jgi:transposase